MTLADYAVNLALVAVVVRQVRGKRLTALSLVWPLGLVAAAAVEYLHGVPSAGNDLALVLAGTATGALLGTLCGVCTRILRLPDQTLVARATGLAAVLWVAGVGARMAFAVYAENGGSRSIARFSASHDITSGHAWTAALVLMSLAEVLGRTVLLAVRGWRAPRTG